MKRVLAIARKEFAHILRDARSLTVTILMPLAMVLLYGSAIDMELHDLPIGLMDLDRSEASRDFERGLAGSGFIEVVERLEAPGDVEPGFRQGRFLAAVVVPRGYARKLQAGEESKVQVLVDASDAATAATVDNYLNAVLVLVNARTAGMAMDRPPGIDLRTRIWFNPELRSPDFVVPGLVALVLMMICALLTSIAVAREKESGTLEQILTTPVTPAQVILGKVIPYTVLGALDAALILLAGRLVFKVPMEGSVWVLAAYCLLFVIIALAVGLLISSRARSLRVAMMAAIIVTMLPTMILSGFMFPLSSMPIAMQWFCRILPPTHFLVIIRGVMLKGRLWFPLESAVLVAAGVLLMTAAVRSFRTDLE